MAYCYTYDKTTLKNDTEEHLDLHIFKKKFKGNFEKYGKHMDEYVSLNKKTMLPKTLISILSMTTKHCEKPLSPLIKMKPIKKYLFCWRMMKLIGKRKKCRYYERILR